MIANRKVSSLALTATLLLPMLILSGCETASKTIENLELPDVKLPNFSNILPESKSHPAKDFPKDQVPHTLLKKPVASGVLTSGFGYRLNPKGVKLPRKHSGIDYAAPVGTPVFASGDGVVEKKYVSKSYGNFLMIKHANGFSSAYAHLDSYAPGIVEGASVARGQVIGGMGNTGRSTASHLHYELRYKGRRIDPLFE